MYQMQNIVQQFIQYFQKGNRDKFVTRRSIDSQIDIIDLQISVYIIQ